MEIGNIRKLRQKIKFLKLFYLPLSSNQLSSVRKTLSSLPRDLECRVEGGVKTEVSEGDEDVVPLIRGSTPISLVRGSSPTSIDGRRSKSSDRVMGIDN